MESSISVANPFRLLAMAGLSAAVLAAAGAPRTANAQIDIRLGNGDFNISVWPECTRVGKIVDPKAVRQQARRQGFRRIRNMTLVKRQYGRSKVCGFYRADANKDGQTYRIYANANSARLLSARATGRVTAPQRVDAQAARRAIQQAGFGKIRNLREAKRGGNDVWVARAEKKGRDYRVFVDAGSGKVIQTAAVGGDRINEQQARRAMRQAGFGKIRNLREAKRGGNDVWVARAEKKGRDYRVFVDAGSGKVIQTAAVGGDRINEQQARRAMRQAGFREIADLRKVERDGQSVWVARATRNGKNFNVSVRDRNGKTVLRGQEIADRRMPEKAVQAALHKDGYRHIENLRFVQRNGGKSFYAAVAWQDGYKWRVHARADSGKAFDKKRLGGRIDADEARKRLRAAGYRRIGDLRWRDSGRAGTYLAQAWRGGTQYRLVARGEDAKVVKDEAIAQRRVDPADVRKAAEADGFSAIDKIDFASGAYVVTAWKDGYRYRLRARAQDGRIVARDRIGGRLSEEKLRQSLGQAGYGRIGAIRFVDDGREGHYVVIAWQKERKYRLYARAESGKSYQRVLIDQRISEDQLRRRLLARGFEKVDDIDLKKQRDGEDYYLASVWKNGHKYRIHARASDGVPYRRELLKPRASEEAIRKSLREAGFEDVRDIAFKEDRVGGHFEATGRRGDSTVHLHLRVHDGSIYRQRVEQK